MQFHNIVLLLMCLPTRKGHLNFLICPQDFSLCLVILHVDANVLLNLPCGKIPETVDAYFLAFKYLVCLTCIYISICSTKINCHLHFFAKFVVYLVTNGAIVFELSFPVRPLMLEEVA